jgi:hypothetical protein
MLKHASYAMLRYMQDQVQSVAPGDGGRVVTIELRRMERAIRFCTHFVGENFCTAILYHYQP